MLEHTFDFLSQLKDNNNKPWFDSHKKEFEKAKAEFVETVNYTIKEIGSFDERVQGLNAKDCIFRIYRDVRFSADKTPYKTHFGAFFTEGGKKSNGPGYYMHIEPGEKSFIGGGIYMPEAPVLQKIRQEIDYNGDKLAAILSKPSFKKYYPKLWEDDKLSRPPKGYETDNPHIELLKLKSFVAGYQVSDESIMKEDFVATAAKAFKELHALHVFLREALA